MTYCKDSVSINKIYSVFLQVILTFCFLSIFFFTYVNTVERESFSNQVNLVIDDLFTDIDINSFLKSFGKNKDIAKDFILGSLYIQKTEYDKESIKENELIKISNNKILKKTIIILIIVFSVLLIITIILYFYKICIPIHIHLKNSLIAIFFIAIIELIFLLVITKYYQSVDPSYIRKELGKTINDYIKKKMKKKKEVTD